jgi:uncharacterized protein (AIM24 family)
MAVPQLLPTRTTDASFAGVTFHIQGELAPMLTLELGAAPVYFEHHILLWKDPHLQVGLKSLRGSFKRMLAGMPILMTEARGPGRIALSRDGAGHTVALAMRSGEGLDVREHQFLAATESLDYSFAWVKGFKNIMFGGTGLFVDTFNCVGPEGILFLYGYGNMFEFTLQPGEQVDMEPGAWVYKDRSVQMETMIQGLTTGIFGRGSQLFWNRFTGPGRVGMQSMSPPLMEVQDGNTNRT